MLWQLLAVVAATLLSSVAHAEQPPTKPKQPDMQVSVPPFALDTKVFTYPSGLRVLMQPDDSSPLVGVTMFVDRGSDHDPKGKEGIAHYVEHLWFKTKHGDNMPKTWDVLKEMGCDLNASTTHDWTNYMTVCGKQHLPAMLKLESLRLTDTLTNVYKEELLIEREVVRNELRLRMEVGGGDTLRYVFEHLYPESHSYHREVIGTHESLSNIELEDIVKFGEVNYRPELATIAVVGDFDIDEAHSLIVQNFALENLHPKATEEHVVRYAKPGVESPDPENPDHWRYTLLDPDDPTKPMSVLTELEPRIKGPSEEPPTPPGGKQFFQHAGPVDRPTVVVSWSIPGGYRETDGLWNVAASTVSSQLYFYFADPFQQRSLNGDRRIYTDPASSQKSVGCSIWGGKQHQSLFCFIELAGSWVDGEDVAEDAVDQIAQLWNPEQNQDMDARFTRARMNSLTNTLNSLDLVSDIRSGRATTIASHAHYTGSATVYSDQMNTVMGAEFGTIKDLLFKYITRDRSVSVEVRPLRAEDLVLDGSDSAYTGATRSNDELNTAIDPAMIDAEFVKAATHPPDLDGMIDKTLDNGLRVVVLPHGVAPVAQITLYTRGGQVTDPPGFWEYADAFNDSVRYEGESGQDQDHDPLRVAADWTYSSNDLWISGSVEKLKVSSGNVRDALWLMREFVDDVHGTTQTQARQGRPDWLRDYKKFLLGKWKDDNNPSWFIARERARHQNPDHPITWDTTIDYLPTMKTWGVSDVNSYLSTKYRPDNATLVVVGNVDAQEAFDHAEYMMGGWQAKRAATPSMFPEVPPPNPAGESKILFYDAPRNSQTDVQYRCPVANNTRENRAAHNLAADLLDEDAWLILRERSGATYGANASISRWPGGWSQLGMSTSIQNDKTALAIQTFRELVDNAHDGKLSQSRLAVFKMNSAQKYGLGHQSVAQMTNRLVGPIDNEWPLDSLLTWGEELAAVDMDQIAEAMGDCRNHAIITLEGPVAVVGPMLDAEGIEYEVVDWRTEADALLAEHDKKGLKKLQKQRAREAEARAANETAGAE